MQKISADCFQLEDRGGVGVDSLEVHGNGAFQNHSSGRLGKSSPQKLVFTDS